MFNSNENKPLIPKHHHFLRNKEELGFTDNFTEADNSFGTITNPTIINNMFVICGKKYETLPAKLSLSICAGFQRPNSTKGISGQHIIARGHLEPFTKYFNIADPWQVLRCVTNLLFSNLNFTKESDYPFMVYAREEC